MANVTIKCPKCGEILRVTFRASLGHASTDEALAVERAIEHHHCK